MNSPQTAPATTGPETLEPSVPSKVAVVSSEKPEYPRSPPFHPGERFPEYPFGNALSTTPNYAYPAVRKLFLTLGFDTANYGTREWNPLGQLVRPGMKVVIKPNFVLSRHTKGKDLFSVITHASVLRAIADYCWIALKGAGSITIADTPQYDCNAEELPIVTGVDSLMAFYAQHSGPRVSFLDLRPYWSRGKHFDSQRLELPGDPAGSLTVNLGSQSALATKARPDQLYGAVYHRAETIRHHTGDCHEYQVSRTMMEADVFISVPKLKVHKKVGVTLNAKGLVGIATNKNYLVHYTLRPPSEGGDQYPDGLFTPVEEWLIRTERWMYDHLLASGLRPLEYLHRSIYWMHNHSTKLLGLKVEESKRMMDAGNWHGNDSAWRMTADLFSILHSTGSDGLPGSRVRRRLFTVIDGIVGGENNGPLTPEPKASGVLIASDDLLAADLVATRLMGFQPLKLRLYQHLVNSPVLGWKRRNIEHIEVVSDHESWRSCMSDSRSSYLGFRPHPGWQGHIEATMQP